MNSREDEFSGAGESLGRARATKGGIPACVGTAVVVEPPREVKVGLGVEPPAEKVQPLPHAGGARQVQLRRRICIGGPLRCNASASRRNARGLGIMALV